MPVIAAAGALRLVDILRAVPLWAYLAVALVAGYIPLGYLAYQKGQQVAQAQYAAEKLAAIAEVQKRAEKAEQAAGLAEAALTAYLSRHQAEIEAARNDSIETVRTIYKDRPVPAGCERPEPVRRLLQERIDQANAAAKG